MTERRKARKEGHRERAILGITEKQMQRAAKKAAAARDYRTRFLAAIGATKWLPEYERAVQIETMERDAEDALLLI